MTTKLIAAALMSGAMMVGPALATDITVGGAAVHLGQDKYGNITISLRGDRDLAVGLGLDLLALLRPLRAIGSRSLLALGLHAAEHGLRILGRASACIQCMMPDAILARRKSYPGEG
jgi:hypothetical protein